MAIDHNTIPTSHVGKQRRKHIALYGNVRIPRAFCGECNRYSFVIDRVKQCCGERDEEQPTHYRRMSEPDHGRRHVRPSDADQRTILLGQDYCCLYCGKRFGDEVCMRSKVIKLRVVWDHMVPFVYQSNSATSNFAAACHICNSWKGALLFGTIEEAQVYLRNKWADSGATPYR